FPATQQGFEQAFEFVLVVLHPLRWKLPQHSVEDFRWEISNPVEPGLEIVQRANTLINDSPRIESRNGRIGEVPMGAVECESVINHQDYKTEFAGRNTGPGEPVI